ncbi:MAG: GDP-L-fucose synthase [Proteobacteria bacterium]|nr:GDP-L-fucose synthase [Pseudomonadota bacterium]
MGFSDRIYVAGHRGLVGSALVRQLQAQGYSNLILRTHTELDLEDSQAVSRFFACEKPDFVFLAAAKVGGILANSTYPADFIRSNLNIQNHVIQASFEQGVKRLMFLGSSCIYPKLAPQPIQESSLLTGPLEPTNQAYALAKIAGIEMCRAYNIQYGTRYLCAMPTNLYGPNDSYDLNNSHVLPALIRKFHEAKQEGRKNVKVWGTGNPRRELLYSDDLADACLFLMNLSDEKFSSLLSSDGSQSIPLINIGCGTDLTIRELAEAVKRTVGFSGGMVFDTSKPDGAPRKLLDVSLLCALGWSARISFQKGLSLTYANYLKSQADRD